MATKSYRQHGPVKRGPVKRGPPPCAEPLGIAEAAKALYEAVRAHHDLHLIESIWLRGSVVGARWIDGSEGALAQFRNPPER